MSVKCDKCREPIVPTFFGEHKTKIWTKYTLHSTRNVSLSVCKACYKEVHPQKEIVDYGLPSG